MLPLDNLARRPASDLRHQSKVTNRPEKSDCFIKATLLAERFFESLGGSAFDVITTGFNFH